MWHFPIDSRVLPNIKKSGEDIGYCVSHYPCDVLTWHFPIGSNVYSIYICHVKLDQTRRVWHRLPLYQTRTQCGHAAHCLDIKISMQSQTDPRQMKKIRGGIG